MRRSGLFACAVAVAAMVSLAGRVAAYEAIDVTNGGKLTGTVKAPGAKSPAKIEVTKDPQICGKEKEPADLRVGPDGALADAVIVVKASKGKKLEMPAQPPVFDQKGCEFHPHVLVFPAGSTIEVLNSDGILHNVHSESTVNPPVNQAQPKFKPKIMIKVEKPEWPIHVKCDVHGWMSGYWISTDQPYVAVTDAQGKFTIADLPPGDYDVEIWHPTLGKKMEKASITAGGDTNVSWTLGG
jgi:plastocyanin